MEIPIYRNFADFKENYDVDISNNPNYLTGALTIYEELHFLYSKYYDRITYAEYEKLATGKGSPAINFFCQNIFVKPKTVLDLTGLPDQQRQVYDIEIRTSIGLNRISQEINSILQFIEKEFSKPKDIERTNDYSGKNELSPKEKLIILDKLGIIKLITDKLEYSDNATHLAEIIGAITGIDNQKGTLTGYCNYLIRSDPYNKNSPYYSNKTKERVNEIYNKFKIKNKTD